MNIKSSNSKIGLAGKITSVVLSAAMVGTAFLGLTGTSISADAATQTTTASTTDYGLADTSQHGVILHCWNWSYNNIKKYMKDIAAAGYTSIQTSPVTQPKDYYWEGIAYGNVGIPDGLGGYEGNWWKVYQPVTMSICDNGNTWFGTKAEFKAMCDEAEKYGVRVIVDIVANHMGNIQGWKIGDVETVMSDISKQVGEFWNPDMLTDPTYWHISTSWVHSSDGRFDVTQGNMGMPDLNTGDSRVQQMVLNLLKECIDCGADGFRFDAAKHIETPADDPAFASNFWDVVLDGARDYYKQVNGYDGVYFYGEILNRIDDANAEAYYRSKMSLTDNSKSDNIRNSVKYDSASGAAETGFNGYIGGDGTKAVLWAESHDTYMGGGSSYDVNDSDIKKTWAMVASRKDSTALFFARPYYSRYILKNDTSGYESRQTYEEILAQTDQTQIGDVGTLTWADKEVVEVNRFHNFFVGQSEKIGSSGDCAYNVRGGKGIVISKMDGAGDVSISGTGMADGTYTDQVSGNTFTVSGGTVEGTVGSEDGIAVVYNPTNQYEDPNPEEPIVIKISAATADGSTSFMSDTIDVTLKTENAVSSTYTTTEGESGSFTGTKTITVGSKTEKGEDVKVTITATAADGTKKEKSFIFTKKAPRTGYPTLNNPGVVFDNEQYNWPKVYVYVYDSSKNNNAAWPGVAMTEVDGNYYTYEFPSNLSGQLYVIFNNGSGVQYPTGDGLKMLSTEKKLFLDKELVDLPETPVGELKVSLSSSASSIELGDTVTLTAAATNNDGAVTYEFTSADGTVIKSYSSSASCTWTPTAAGTYTITVNAKDSSSTASATTKITVIQTETPLANNSTVSETTINKGESITINASATGGTAPYQYAVTARHSTASSWTVLKGYNTTATHTWTPGKTG
ncbi:MAG: alpha-amylase family glycosyl hydrolase, partial [Acutalibacteraceae bacterium]